MGISERKEREKQARRQSILDAARELFTERGFDQATIDEIAERAEVSKGTVYLYFTSKSELFGAMVSEGLGLLAEYFDKATSGVDDPQARLFSIGEAFQRFFQEENTLARALFFLSEKEDILSPETFDECEAKGNLVNAYTIKALQDGIDAGVFHEEINATVLGHALWAAFTGIELLVETMPHKITREVGDAMHAELTACIRRGVAK